MLRYAVRTIIPLYRNSYKQMVFMQMKILTYVMNNTLYALMSYTRTYMKLKIFIFIKDNAYLTFPLLVNI